MEMKQKYYALQKKNGTFLSYKEFGVINDLPIVYETKPLKKKRMFDAEIVEVYPTHLIQDSEGNSFLYFLDEKSFNETIDKLVLDSIDKVIVL